jgi:hypothetical protein
MSCLLQCTSRMSMKCISTLIFFSRNCCFQWMTMMMNVWSQRLRKQLQSPNLRKRRSIPNKVCYTPSSALNLSSHQPPPHPNALPTALAPTPTKPAGTASKQNAAVEPKPSKPAAVVPSAGKVEASAGGSGNTILDYMMAVLLSFVLVFCPFSN